MKLLPWYVSLPLSTLNQPSVLAHNSHEIEKLWLQKIYNTNNFKQLKFYQYCTKQILIAPGFSNGHKLAKFQIKNYNY